MGRTSVPTDHGRLVRGQWACGRHTAAVQAEYADGSPRWAGRRRSSADARARDSRRDQTWEYGPPTAALPSSVWVRNDPRDRRDGGGSRSGRAGGAAQGGPGDRRADRRQPGLRPGRVAAAAASDGRLRRADLPGRRPAAFGGGHADPAGPADGPLRWAAAHAP